MSPVPPAGRRPRVVVSVTASADGRVALGRSRVLLDEHEGARWRSLHPAGAEELLAARRAQIESRHQPRAVLEGSGTFVSEPAAPVPPLPPAESDESVLLQPYLPGPPPPRWFVVVDGRGRIRWTHRGDAEVRLLVLVSHSTPLTYLDYLRREEIPYLVAGLGRVDLALALEQLGSRLGVGCVVSEAGGGLNGALLRAGLIDELHLVLLPTLIGGRDTPTTFDGPALALGDLPASLRLQGVRTTPDGVVWLHYDVAAGPAGDGDG